MKDRIAHIMRAKNLKASDFATLLGIQPSGVSHILAGRNQPSLEFVKKIKETFPEYNLDWIIFGTGPMTTSEPFKEPKYEPENDNSVLPESLPLEDETLFVPTETTKGDNPAPVIKSMIVLYDDGTFDSYQPR